MAAGQRSVWVCWREPPRQAFVTSAAILSFLPPIQEEALAVRSPHTVVRARVASQGVRTTARRLYVHLVARLGLATDRDGQTLRQRLTVPGHASRWWFHPVTFKDCEVDPTFNDLIAILTICATAAQARCDRLILDGAPARIVAVLKTRFHVVERSQRRSHGWVDMIRAIATRLRYGARLLRDCRRLRRRSLPGRSFQVALCGFWSWSVRWDQTTGKLVDKYFGQLPTELRSQQISCGWLAWYDPHQAQPTSQATDQVVMLQSLLRWQEVCTALMDLRPWWIVRQFHQSGALRAACWRDGLNYYPLFSDKLIQGTLDSSLPHGGVVALATQRACQRYRPTLMLSFLEHFPHARACYEGAQRAAVGTTSWAVQHASYSHEKTFLLLHPTLEFQGRPDGVAVPHPAMVCTMGTWAQRVLRTCGYSRQQLVPTGTPRYEYLRAIALTRGPVSLAAGGARPLEILVALGFDLATELELVDAVCAATDGMAQIRIRLRPHPLQPISRHPAITKWNERITISQAPLDDDVRAADLVLFTYSTVAEEAFVLGKPVWQWLPTGFNSAALAAVMAIPRFGSIGELRTALERWCQHPHQGMPSPAERAYMREQLFSAGTRTVAAAVADVLV